MLAFDVMEDSELELSLPFRGAVLQKYPVMEWLDFFPCKFFSFLSKHLLDQAF